MSRSRDAGGELEEPEADCGELGPGERVSLRDGVAHGEDQPIGGGVKDEAHLIGGGGSAAGAVGGKLGLVQLDQVWPGRGRNRDSGEPPAVPP